MSSTIQLLSTVLLTIMLWATGLGLGMQFTLGQIVAPLRRPTLISMMVILNLILIPLITWGMTLLFHIKLGYATGILLTTFSMAAPLSLKYVQGAGGNVPYAIALVMLLQFLNILAIPLWSVLLLPGGVQVNPLQVVGTLLLDVLLPLAIGLLVKALYPTQAASWHPGLGKASTWALILVIVLTLFTDLPVLFSLIGSFALLVSILTCLIALALGYLLGGTQETEKRTGAIVTAVRAVGPALLIANQAFATQPQVIAGSVVVGVVTTILPMLAMVGWNKRQPESHEQQTMRTTGT